MSEQSSKSPQVVPKAPAEAAADDASRTKSSGRAAFDSRGNAVWEWKSETGHFRREVSTKRLKKLEASELTLEKTAIAKKPEGMTAAAKELPCGGFNPYDTGKPGAAKPIARPQSAARPRPRPAVVAPPARKNVLQRLRALIDRK